MSRACFFFKAHSAYITAPSHPIPGMASVDLFSRSAALLLQKPGISKVGVYLQVRKRESREEPQTSKAEVCATLAERRVTS